MSGTVTPTKVITASGDALIDGVLTTKAWNGTVYYSFPTDAASYGYTDPSVTDLPANFVAVTAAQQTAVHFALNNDGSASGGFSVEGFTNLTIAQDLTPDSTNTIRVANTDSTTLPVARVADFPGNQFTSDVEDNGDVWFGNVDDGTPFSLKTPQASNYAWATHLHELGHALGLSHGHTTFEMGVALPAQYDAMEFSIMTYRSYVGGPTTGYSNEQWGFAQTYMMSDIAALQYMYGANFTTNSGNTVYSWDPNSGNTLVNGAIGIAPGANRIFATIWDGGGIDTYDLSAYSTDLVIDLTPGGSSLFSTVQQANLGNGNFARGNIYNALQYQGDARSLIENATGGSGNDSIGGNVANNLLIGGAGDDTLSGNGGNDTLIGGDGADAMNGGGGIDTVSYAGSGTRVVARLNGTAGAFGAAGDTIFTVENLIGSVFNDRLFGNTLANLLEGGAGSDDIFAGGGNDTIIGGDGADVMHGGGGIDTVSYAGSATGVGAQLDGTVGTGGAAGDTIFTVENLIGSAFDDTLVGNGSANRMEGGGGIDTVSYAGSGTRVVAGLDGTAGAFGAAGDTIFTVENLIGSGLNDELFGNELANRIEGGAGDDDIFGGAGDDTLIGGLGADTLDGGDGNDTLDGGDGNDTLNGGVGADSMFGGDDRDTFIGGNDGDAVDGGTDGDDYDILDLTGLGRTEIVSETVDADGDSTSGTINFLDSDGTVTGSMAFAEIEEIIRDPHEASQVDGLDSGEDMGPGYTDLQGDMIDGADGDDDTIFGNGGDDTIASGVGDDTVHGGGGDDTLNGGGGSDVLEGGPGNDTFVLSQSVAGELDVMIGGDNTDTADFSLFGSAVWVGLGYAGDHARTNDTGEAGTTEDFNGRSVVSVFRTIANLISIENLIGTAFDDWLIGDAGNNVLEGGLGDDTLEGGLGDDTLQGGGGDDILDGGAGSDTMTGGSGADIFVFSSGQAIITDFLDNIDTIVLELDQFTGTSLTAQQIVDTYGSIVAGNAVLDFGVDRLTVNGVTDLQVLVNDLMQTRVGDISIGNPAGTAADDWLIGDARNNVLEGGLGDDTLEGGLGDDTLQGGGGDDTLNGEEGNDSLDGGAGSDTMTGGSGADVFVFSSGQDVITDFQDNIDTIVLQLDVLILDPFSDSSLTAQQIVDTYGSIVAGNAVLDFGADRLTINGVTDLQVLVNDLL